MGEIKNPFSFGTGDIDKDQWLRDIDNEQDAFITRYGNATNKHRTTLLRQAFQDLRRRIASGDMLNRTADGLYQFGSALIRDDKHMQEAYQRALGFMGDLARRLINTPAPELEKKAVGSLEERYIKSINPQGTFNTEAYWSNQTDEERRKSLRNFLNKELQEVDKYSDFDSFGGKDTYVQRLQNVMDLLDSGKANDWSLQQLGFTKNWLTQPKTEETQPKSEVEQAQEAYNAALAEQQAAEIRRLTAALQASNPIRQELFSFNPGQYWTYDSYQNELDKRIKRLLYTDADGKTYLKSGTIFSQSPSGMTSDGRRIITTKRSKVNTAWNGKIADLAREFTSNLYEREYNTNLDNYFKNLGVNYLSAINNDRTRLMFNLSLLFANKPGNTPQETLWLGFNTIGKYFTQQLDGTFGLKGTNISYDPINGKVYQTSNIDNYKDGGVIKAQQGYVFDNSRYITTPKLEVTNTSEDKKPKEEMTTGDWVNILGPVTLDIGSMLTANVPGYGTIASGIAGLGSTIWSGIYDASKGQFNATGTLASLGADAFGLVPGWGISAKVGKIAKNVLRYSKPLMYAFTARGLTDAGNVLAKGIDKGFDSLDKNDWEQLAAGFTSLMGGAAKGTAAIKRSNLQEMRRASASKKTFNYIDSNGDIKSKTVGINDDISGELRVSRPKIYADKEGVIKGRTQALDGFNAGYGIASNKRFGMLYELARQGDVPLHSWETWEWKVPRLINTDKAKQQLMKLRGSQKPKTETPKAETPNTKSKIESKKKTTPKKKKTEAEKKQIGGILYALRNGGVVKAQWGDNTTSWDWTQQLKKPEELTIYTNPYFSEVKYNGTAPWYKSRFNSESLNSLIDSKSYTNPNLQGRFTGTNLDFAFNKNMAYVRSGLENKQKDILNYFNLIPMLNASNLEELTQVYNQDIDLLYNTFNKDLTSPDYKKSDASSHNNLFKKVYGSRATGQGDLDSYDIGWDENLLKTFGSNSFARRPVNYETKFEDDLKNNLAQAKDRVSKISYGNIEGYVYTDENGRIHPVSPELLKILGEQNQLPNNETIRSDTADKKEAKVKEIEMDTPFETKIKNPFDPTPFLIAGKTITGILGNKNIYSNLIKEMPQAPLRDPINRQLAIVGWQERIKQGQNQLADLRRIQQMQRGSDQQTNFATALETERTGRDIMDKAFQEDSGRQFETALKLWNLKNEDTMYNIGVGDANRKAIADRARMIAQIRAAWRSGDNNILMGALSDTGNWLMKKYQREQDLVDAAKMQQLGSLESYMEDYVATKHPDYEALKTEYQDSNTSIERKKQIAKIIQSYKIEAQRNAPKAFAQAYYNTYHTPWFGGGFSEVVANKDGGKMEIEKLKARGKDNDRYVSMIKNLHSTRRRRRRRFYYED